MKCKKNQVKKLGICFNKSKHSSSYHKSYNPFKMWGSWIGAVSYPILLFLVSDNFLANLLSYPIKIFVRSSGCEGFDCLGMIIPAFIFVMVLGFLLGWGINIAWRKLIR